MCASLRQSSQPRPRASERARTCNRDRRASSGAVERATHTLKRMNQDWQMIGQEVRAVCSGVHCQAAVHALAVQPVSAERQLAAAA